MIQDKLVFKPIGRIMSKMLLQAAPYAGKSLVVEKCVLSRKMSVKRVNF